MSTSSTVPSTIESLQFLTARASQLRIAIINDAIAGRNGVGTYYDDLIKHLDPFVQSIQLISPGLEYDAELEKLSISMPGDKTQRMSWPRYGKLCRLLDKQKPNLIVVPSLGGYAYCAAKYARASRIPLAVVNHTNFEELAFLYCPRLLAKPASWMLHQMNLWLMRRATAVAAMDSESLESARNAGVGQIRVMGTPLPPEFLSKPTRPVSQSIRNIIYVGRLATEKNIPKFIEAARSLPRMNFTVIGDGPLRQMVEVATGQLPNLHSMGWIGRERVIDEIDNSDVLVLPSAVETFGTVALEALARRRFVLTSRECGISKWPTLSTGLFNIGANESVASGLTEIARLSAVDRNLHAQPSWAAVQMFNQNTIRVWISFLADAVASSHRSGSSTLGLEVA